MNLTKFTGGCEALIEVDVKDLIRWVDGIDRETWPAWFGKGPERPSVVNDPGWEGLNSRTQRIVSELLELFPKGSSDTYRSMTVVHPGDYVPPHTDTLCPGWLTRIHVPIVTNPKAVFIVEGKEHHMEVGMSYQVNPGRQHAIRNGGKASRIHLMFDVKRL
jgi:hypothetical protein